MSCFPSPPKCPGRVDFQDTIKMNEPNDPPLVSFCLVAYNQERFIREAVESAFAQDYPVLEILLSDDCSSDVTFDIMQEMASKYAGPHRIILNRNQSNLGVGLHVNRMVELTSGTLIICAAGDDVSHPERARSLCEEWMLQERLPTSIQSDYEVIDDQSRSMADNHNRNFFSGKWSGDADDIAGFLRGTHPSSRMLGATHAFSRTLFQEFGTLNPEVSFEDIVIGFRSLLSGSFAYVPRKLVRYRMHSNNIYGRIASNHVSGLERRRQGFADTALKARRWAVAINNFSDDAKKAVNLGYITRDDEVGVLREIDRCHKIKLCEYNVYAGSPGIALLALCQRLLLRPQWGFCWCATKHWLFRTADFIGLLPKR